MRANGLHAAHVNSEMQFRQRISKVRMSAHRINNTEEMANANLARDDTPVKRELGNEFPREQSQHHQVSLLEYHCTMLSRRHPSIMPAR